MNTINALRTLAGVLVTASLTACATPASNDDAQQGTPAVGMGSGGSGMGMMGASQSGSGMMGGSMMSGMDHGQAKPAAATNKEAMCAVYQKMQKAQTEQERQDIAAQHMQGMSPEMRQQHLDMMRQRCGQ